MSKRESERVDEEMKLLDGTLWPVPVVLELPGELAETMKVEERLVLREPEGVALAVLTVEEIWSSSDGRSYLAGTPQGLQYPTHHDFKALRKTPHQLLAQRLGTNQRDLAAFQVTDVIGRAELDAAMLVAGDLDADLLLQVLIAPDRQGALEYFAKVRFFQALQRTIGDRQSTLLLMPLATKAAGLPLAMLRAIVARNYACRHLLVASEDGQPAATLDALRSHQAQIGIEVHQMPSLVHVAEETNLVPIQQVAGRESEAADSKALQKRLLSNQEIPGWLVAPEALAELKRAYPARRDQGFAVLFSGLPCAGKSTVANLLMIRLMEEDLRSVSLLDGDIVRRNLSSELGFSKEDRDINVRRIGFVAAEIVKSGGVAICAPIAPYDCTRKAVRQMVETYGGFVLVHVATPLEKCEERDSKGLYAKARAGTLSGFTGISDPYEIPDDAQISLDTSDGLPEECVETVMSYLRGVGFLAG